MKNFTYCLHVPQATGMITGAIIAHAQSSESAGSRYHPLHTYLQEVGCMFLNRMDTISRRSWSAIVK